MSDKKRIARCVGHRHVEIGKAPDGNMLLELKWRETTTLCGLIFTPEEARKLHKAIGEYLDSAL